MPNYKSLNKGLRVITLLAGHELDGLSPAEIAVGANLSASDGTHYRKHLIEAGYVEEVPGTAGRYRLTPKIIQLARACDLGLQRLRSRADEVEQRYSRIPT